jgi:16S rRNA (cytidine1402-2'-O)-methyltransferase
LKEADYIACEDTRHTKILLDKYEIKTPLLSYHAHSSHSKDQKLIALLLAGKKIALVSDAGTPGISDPGYRLIQEAIQNNIPISPLPGSSAFLTALQASGLPVNRFLYLGFLPIKKGRQTLWHELKKNKYTIVFYESCHRLQKTLQELTQYFDVNRQIVIARQLTKLHEEFIRIKIGDIPQLLTNMKIKGEYVIIIH